MPTLTPIQISEADRQQFADRGYFLMPQGISDELLARGRALAERLEADALSLHAKGEHTSRTCVISGPTGPRVMRCDDVLFEDPDFILDLLASPEMLAVAREFVGRGSVPMHCDILHKHAHPYPVILWHQGAQHSRKFPYLNVGIYLDDAPVGDGCLRYVPGTQHELQPIAELTEQHGWEIPGVVEQGAKAGDILIQDMMILHGSQPKRIPGVRRTIYVELRPFEGILETAAQSPAWAELRRRWMALVLRRAPNDAWPEEWRNELPADLGSDAEEIAAIEALHENPIPAVYGTHPVSHPEYPVPSDLR